MEHPPQAYGAPDQYGAPPPYDPAAPPVLTAAPYGAAALLGPKSPGRPGPPLWLGLIIMIVGPIAFMIAAGAAAVSAFDLSSLTTPVSNPTRVAADANTTYLVASEQNSVKPCYVKRGLGKREPIDATQVNPIDTPGGTFYTRGGITTTTGESLQIGCPQGGPRLMVIALKTEGLGQKIGLKMLGGGLCFLIGLLMVIFRRKKPKY